jgi:hypothetical protein
LIEFLRGDSEEFRRKRNPERVALSPDRSARKMIVRR